MDITKRATTMVFVSLVGAVVGYYSMNALSTRHVVPHVVESVERESGMMAEMMAEVAAETSTREFMISPYDSIFRSVCYLYENDWRLMSAIAYHESRFTSGVVSSQGARGLMQIMPSIANSFGVESDSLLNVEVNILVANMLMNRIEDMMKFPDSINNHDRTALTLACYNGGIGYIRSAQRLAMRNGHNPFSWSVIAPNLKGMSNLEFAAENKVRYFGGASQTLAYVENVMWHYDHYCEIADL